VTCLTVQHVTAYHKIKKNCYQTYNKSNLEAFLKCIQFDILLLPFVLQKEQNPLQPSAALPASGTSRDVSGEGLQDLSEKFNTGLHIQCIWKQIPTLFRVVSMMKSKAKMFCDKMHLMPLSE
jgi:hypothetical protein